MGLRFRWRSNLGRRGRWRGGCCPEQRHKIAAHFAQVTDALGDSHAIQAFEDFYRETAAKAATVAVLPSRKLPAGCGHGDNLRNCRELSQCGARVKAIRCDAYHFAGAAFSVQKILEYCFLNIGGRRELA